MSEPGRPPGDGASDGDLGIVALLRLDGAHGPARRLSSARSSAMVTAVLDAVASEAGRRGGAPRSSAEPRPAPALGPAARTASPSTPGVLREPRPGPGSLRVRAGAGRARAGPSARAGLTATDTTPGSTARARAIASPNGPIELTRAVSPDDASIRRPRRPRHVAGRGVLIAAVLAVASVASGAAAIWIGSAAGPRYRETAVTPAPAPAARDAKRRCTAADDPAAPDAPDGCAD